jgi:predicted helicase
MSVDHRQVLLGIKRFDQLIAYLRDELGWPISRGSFDDVDDLFYDFSAEELGIDPKTAAKIQEIKRLRPLSTTQPWGIFFIKFEPKKLPVVALRRILGQVALKKRASANSAERTAWSADDLLFISNYGEGEDRQISFAHFSQSSTLSDLPTLRVLGWNNLDTPLHLDAVAAELTNNLRWPTDDQDLTQWRKSWSNAFKLGHNEVINTAKLLSERLAELASSIRDRIKSTLSIESENGPLTKLMKAFQSSLVHDLTVDGFADMYAQTIAYGLLSARITDPSKKTVDDFTSHMRTSPFLKELLETFLHIGGRKGRAGSVGIDFDELGVGDVVNLLDSANMEAVVRDFGDKNRQEDPVMHFFEGFLHAYDSKIRKDRGVFYTPQPVVSYIVQSVHEILKANFGLEDGLADTATWSQVMSRHPNLVLPHLTDSKNEENTISLDEPFVQILDPATGTATFIVEVIDIIFRTMTTKWERQGLTVLQQRSAWDEYVPKHLLPRVHAYELMMAPYAIAHMKIGLKLSETGYRFNSTERARVYLTNALEPWHKQLRLPEIEALAHEATEVNKIKQHKRFTVIIGNPPYSGESMNKGDWIRNFIETYMYVDDVHLGEKGKKNWLQDDYVKFLRFAQFSIDTTGYGVVGFINNHSYLDNPTFRGMRNSLMKSFSSIQLLDLHGNSKKKEKHPDGELDENVFDIQQGVSIGLFSHSFKEDKKSNIFHADLWGPRTVAGTKKNIGKYSWLSTNSYNSTKWSELNPSSPFFLFVPQDIDLRDEYEKFWKLSDVMPIYGAGIITSRDGFVIDFDDAPLLKRMELFHDGSISDDFIRDEFELKDNSIWKLKEARKSFQKKPIQKKLFSNLLYRPYDKRRIYFDDDVVFNMRKQIMRNLLRSDNLALITTRQTKEPWSVLVSRDLVAHKATALYDVSSVFPLFICNENTDSLLESSREVNISQLFVRAVNDALKSDSSYRPNPEEIFGYIYGIFHSPSYRSRYINFLKLDFPRIPLTSNNILFKKIAELANQLIKIQLLESSNINSPAVKFVGVNSQQVDKISWSLDTVWIDKIQSTGFEGITQDVWEFHIGGYQVCEKWLKDRKGRVLSDVDIHHYKKILVAISETIKVMNEIDLVIDNNGGWPNAFEN